MSIVNYLAIPEGPVVQLIQAARVGLAIQVFPLELEDIDMVLACIALVPLDLFLNSYWHRSNDLHNSRDRVLFRCFVTESLVFLSLLVLMPVVSVDDLQWVILAELMALSTILVDRLIFDTLIRRNPRDHRYKYIEHNYLNHRWICQEIGNVFPHIRMKMVLQWKKRNVLTASQ